jgi:hypothetical protein
MAETARQPEDINASAETLLRQTLAECEQAADRLRDLLRLADALIAVLPPNGRIAYLESAARFRAAARTAPADALNDNIVEFVKAQQGVTTAEVREALTAHGVAVDQKQVANSLAYLARRNRIHRIAPGWYCDPEANAREVEKMLTERYGPPTHRGLPPGMNQEPDCY